MDGQVVMGIDGNGMPVEVAINDVLGVVSAGRLSHVGAYKQMANERLVETHVNVLHWDGTLPQSADLSSVGLQLLMLSRSLQSDPCFSIFAKRNVNLEPTCCQPPLQPLQVLAPGRDIKAVAVRLRGGVVLPYGAYGANTQPTVSDGARVSGEPWCARTYGSGVSVSSNTPNAEPEIPCGVWGSNSSRVE